MNENEIVRAAQYRFDPLLHTREYRAVHSDAEHLESLISLFEIRCGKSYLDLGTGNGYIAFELARRFESARVFGLDVAEKSIEMNRLLAKKENLENLWFATYRGVELPYADGAFHGSICRYALHHFPDINKTIEELSRIIEQDGFFIYSDPMTLDEDDVDFIDRFQSLVPDGHVHFYRRPEIEKLFSRQHFRVETEFIGSIRYPRQINGDYEDLIEHARKDLVERYMIEMAGHEIFITVPVLNILFRH